MRPSPCPTVRLLDVPVLNAPILQRMKEAQAAFDALPPVDKALHRADQRVSFIRGQLGREIPEEHLPGEALLALEVRRLREEVAGLRRALGLRP